MKPELLWNSRNALEGFAAPSALLAFDFDGTLAPVVRDRTKAVMRPSTADLFIDVCERYPCAVISGRSRHDVMSRLGGSSPLMVIGNHGAEYSDHPSGRWLSLMREVLKAISDSPLASLDVEDKGVSLSVHYWPRTTEGGVSRDAPDDAPEVTLLHLHDLQDSLNNVLGGFGEELRFVPGHRVINVVPSDSPTKGDALRRLIESRHASPVLYVGDDVTDEDAFRLGAPLITGVRIGWLEDTLADFWVEKQEDIDRILQRLLDERPVKSIPAMMAG